MAESLQQRVIERKVYEEVVTMVVDYVYKQFNNDESARLRIYAMISENFDGVVRCLSSAKTPIMLDIIESGDKPEDE